jgi:hypothetical protein
MSTALAIASVTAVLKDLLNNGLIDHDVASTVGNVSVSALPPDRIDLNGLNQQSQLNLFMYQVTPNPAWRNVGLPVRDSRGDRTGNNPLALDLHYLLTAYGAAEFHSEILLGYGMQLLHETPVLTRQSIRTALAPPTPVSGGSLPPFLQPLFTSELAEQVEQIKIWPETLNTEEISRMWTAFQAHYRPTAAYQVSVVLIESKASARAPLPVLRRGVYVVPFKHPLIQQIKSQEAPGAPIVFGQPILAGHHLVITGTRLKADEVGVDIGGFEQQVDEHVMTDDQLVVPIPGQLRTGLQSVQVIHYRQLGDPPPRRGIESNLAAFVLRPRIQSAGTTVATGPGGGPVPAVNVTVDPPVGDTQRAVLLLNELSPMTSPPASPLSGERSASYSFPVPPRVPFSPPPGPPGESATLTVPIAGVKPATYLVRLQVDGADSPLTADPTGRFAAPTVVVP